jgi:hypothetical protein
MNAAELMPLIRAEMDELSKLSSQRTKLIKQIEDTANEALKTAEQEWDSKLMSTGTRILAKITHILETSTEDRGELQKALDKIFSDDLEDGKVDETDENIEALQRILAKARFSHELANTLNATLTSILEEAMALKKLP